MWLAGLKSAGWLITGPAAYNRDLTYTCTLFSVLVSKLSLLFFIQENGWTALMLAAAGGHVNVLKTLIENKADVNMLTKVHVLHNNNTLTHPLISREIWCCM